MWYAIMKIVFVSNFYNHHQSALSEALYHLTNGEYLFIATSRMPEERRALGYGQEKKPEYVRCAYENAAEQAFCQQHINEADVVITGSAPEYLIRERIKMGKLTFRYSERPLKRGFEPWKYLVRLLRWHARNPMRKPIYMLCSSAYTASDYRKFGLFRNRCYKWGYFPEVKRYEDFTKVQDDKTPNSILWAGRFIDWKHPDDVIRVAKRLKGEGFDFQMRMLGNGVLWEEMNQLIKDLGLQDCVQLVGAVPSDQVRSYMESASIYLFTSDRNEGWGAVLNESMNSGCAVVACDAIGAVPFLMKDGENGLCYHSGNQNELYEKVKYLLENPQVCRKLGENAYDTMTTMWNAEVAAERLVRLVECLQKGEDTPFLHGPCSKAEILKDNAFK